MTSEYLETHTSSWHLEKEKGRAALWSFFDRVDWKHKHAIKVDGEVKSVFDTNEHELDQHEVLRIVSECL
ncbi:hypothetical protein [Paenibacillus xylanexedens]|uniref:hypothetical protein n=1 Tax=Paenibacillus xylanexedens TaxID=528191 RepID=UPI000F543B54|nr:hypothetical protein [Paenibacillus xylanexedens]